MNISYYDCVRYAFLFVAAKQGKVKFGFDNASLNDLESDNQQSDEVIQALAEVQNKNGTAVLFQRALRQEGVSSQFVSVASQSPYTPVAITSSTIDTILRSFHVGDVMIYTPVSTWSNITSTEQALQTEAEELAFSAINTKLVSDPSQSKLSPVSSADAPNLINNEFNRRQKAKESRYTFLMRSLLPQNYKDALISKASGFIVAKTQNSISMADIKAWSAEFWQRVDAAQNLSSKVFFEVNAMDEQGKPVKAGLLHLIPNFHVAMVSKINGQQEPIVFQIDGANEAIGSTFRPMRDILTEGAYLSILRPD